MVGSVQPQPPSSAMPVDRSKTTQEVLDDLQSSNSPTIAVRKGGYIRSADGIAKRGKTRGKLR